MKNQKSGNFKVGGSKASYVLIICSLLYAVNAMDRQVMSVVLQPMKLDLGLTDLQIGAINSAFFIGVGVFCTPIAHLVDIWSRKKMIGLMGLAWSFFTLLTGICSGFVSLLIARLGVGVGEAGFSAGGTALISASYPEEKRAQKLGIFNMFIVIGMIVSAVLGGYLSASTGNWRMPFYIFGIPGIILGILAFFMQDYSLKKADGSEIDHESFFKKIKLLLKIPTLRWLYFGIGMYAVVQISIMTWFPALLMRAYGIKEDKAGAILGIVALFGILGPILGGIFADKWEKKRTGGRMRMASVSIVMSTIFAFLAGLAMFDLANKTLMIFCAIMMPLQNICLGMSLPPCFATTQDVVPAKMKGLSTGTFYLAMMAIGLCAPVLVGGLSDGLGGGYKGLAYALYISASFGFVATWAWWIAARHIESDVKIANQGN